MLEYRKMETLSLTNLQEVIDSYQELQRMHQLNIELLEQLALACNHLVVNHVKVPNVNTFNSLVSKAMTLLNEVTADETKLLVYRKTTDGFLQRKRTDDNLTEPKKQ